MAGELSNPRQGPFIPLEDVDPGKMSFGVLVRAECVTPAVLNSLTPQSTTYREFAALGLERIRVDETTGIGSETYGDNYVYSHHQTGPGTLHTFYFVNVRTDLQRQTPIETLSYVTSDTYPWPDVIHKLWFVEDPYDPMTVTVDGVESSIPRLFKRLEMTEGGNLPTLFRVRVFASHAPFPESMYALDPPVPGRVWWDMRNQSGSLTALHPYIEFPESQPRGRLFFGAGTVRENITFGMKTIFPATNHRDWRNHVCVENVRQVRGVYMLEQREVIVPRGRRKIINAT